MRRPLLPLTLALSALLVGGCSPMRYSQFTGADRPWRAGLWHVGTGTMAETSYAVPVYRGWPEKHYKVLGSVRFEDPRKHWDDGVISMAARAGKKNGGDAIIIRQGAEFGVSKITGVVNLATSLSQNQTAAFVIRWLTPEEIAKEEADKARFLREYQIEHPNTRGNETVKEILIQYLLRDYPSQVYTKEMATQFAQALESLASKRGDDPSGTWAYKGSVATSSIASMGDEDTLLGLATVKVDGDNIAILSNAGRTEISFQGSLVKGRVQGQIGIASFTSKAEGAALDNKISLSFQAITTDGAVRGSLVLQR